LPGLARLVATLSLVGVVGVGAGALSVAAAAPSGGLEQSQGVRKQLRRTPVEANPRLDRSGRRRVGKASFYAGRFVGRKMADGTRMNPSADNAASKTLPLGTTAKVTNLETGKSAVVTIRDRGPYVDGRIVDLTPATAQKIGLEPKQGVTKVAVAPIVVPLPDGQIKLGEAVAKIARNNDSR
jgi:rare lipoprotein A